MLFAFSLLILVSQNGIVIGPNVGSMIKEG